MTPTILDNCILVKKEQLKSTTTTANLTALAVIDGDNEPIITCHNPATKNTGIARTKNLVKVKIFVAEFISYEKIDPQPITQIRLLSDGPQQHEAFFKNLLAILQELDQNKNILNIISSDLNFKHPFSFKITSLDGKIGRI